MNYSHPFYVYLIYSSCPSGFILQSIESTTYLYVRVDSTLPFDNFKLNVPFIKSLLNVRIYTTHLKTIYWLEFI